MKEFMGSKTPWKVESVPSGLDVWNEEHCICLVDSYNVDGYEANAHLISAAPDLLNALQFVLKDIEQFGEVYGSTELLCREAISKALNH